MQLGKIDSFFMYAPLGLGNLFLLCFGIFTQTQSNCRHFLLFNGFSSLVWFGHSGIAENCRCIISVSSYQLIRVQLYCLSNLSASDLMAFFTLTLTDWFCSYSRRSMMNTHASIRNLTSIIGSVLPWGPRHAFSPSRRRQ